MNIFKRFLRSCTNAKDVRKWYYNKDVTPRYYDEEIGKWVKSSCKESAKSVLVSTWEGEDDILNIALLKIEHMIFNLKKYGVQADCYFNTGDFKKAATEEDRNWAIKKIVNLKLENEKTAKRFSERFEKSSSKKDKNEGFWKASIPIGYLSCAKNDIELAKFKEARTNGIIPKNENGDDIKDFTHISKSGIVNYYFYHIYNYDKFGSQNTYGIECNTLGEDGKVNTFSYSYVPTFWNIEDIQNYLNDQDIQIDFVNDLIDLQQVIYIEPKDFPLLSNSVSKYITGNRQTIKELLQLRRKIKKLRNLSDLDDKYQSWVDAPKEKSKEELLKCMEMYRNDRKELYRSIADFMAEKGDTWWD